MPFTIKRHKTVLKNQTAFSYLWVDRISYLSAGRFESGHAGLDGSVFLGMQEAWRFLYLLLYLREVLKTNVSALKGTRSAGYPVSLHSRK